MQAGRVCGCAGEGLGPARGDPTRPGRPMAGHGTLRKLRAHLPGFAGFCRAGQGFFASRASRRS